MLVGKTKPTDPNENIGLEKKELDALFKSSPNTNAITAAQPTQDLPDTVTVLEGESLYKVALRIYGRGNDYVRLYAANKSTIADPNIVRVGQVLQVPK
jgi:nucleoid-associated protein YgaU